MSVQSSPFRTLFLKARHGDEEARGELLQLCRKLMSRGRRRMLDSAVTSFDDDDFWQEVFHKVVRSWKSVRTKRPGGFYRFVRKVISSTRRRLENRYVPKGKRDPARELRLDDEANAYLRELMVSDALSPEQLAESREREGLVRRAVKQLRPDEGEIVEMWMDGMTLEEIAAHFGESYDAVRERWRAARDRLKTRLRVCS